MNHFKLFKITFHKDFEDYVDEENLETAMRVCCPDGEFQIEEIAEGEEPDPEEIVEFRNFAKEFLKGKRVETITAEITGRRKGKPTVILPEPTEPDILKDE